MSDHFTCLPHYVPVNSKTAHPPPPGQTPGHLTFLKKFGQIPRYVASLDGQMPPSFKEGQIPHPPGMLLMKSANINRIACLLETSSAKFSATTNFLFSFSSLHTLNKGIFHDITVIKRQQQKPTWNRQMTRASRAESKNCEILLFQPLTGVLTRKSNAPPGGPHFGSNSPVYGA